MNKTILLITAVAFAIGLLFVLRYRWFTIKMKTAENNFYRAQRKDMLRTAPSYSKYKKIAAKKSVRNTTSRKSGDFLDFFLSFPDEKGATTVEGKLSTITCGEIYE